MSTFQVTLRTLYTGQMDNFNVAGNSLQRQVFVMGPKRINRLLVDGATFDDCNYWKQYCPYNASTNPYGCDPKFAFLTLVSDDGSVYSPVASENTFAVSATYTINNGAYNLTNVMDVAGTYGSYAVSAILQAGAANSVVIRINGGAEFTLAAGATQVFNQGDLTITKIEAKQGSGASTLQVFVAVRTQFKS